MNPANPSSTRVNSGQSGGSVHSARALAFACITVALALPLVTALQLAIDWPASLLAALASGRPPGADAVSLGNGRLMLAAVLAMLPVLLMACSLVLASQCFFGFARGEHFAVASVRRLRSFARMMFVASLASMCVPPLITLAMTLGTDARGSVRVAIDSQHIILLLFAGIVWQIARVFARGVELADENAQFV